MSVEFSDTDKGCLVLGSILGLSITFLVLVAPWVFRYFIWVLGE